MHVDHYRADPSRRFSSSQHSPIKSPNEARQRMLNDVYGIKPVEDDSNNDWKPSNRGSDEKQKKRLSMEHQKLLLQDQMDQNLRVKELEKQKERLEDEKIDRMYYQNAPSKLRQHQHQEMDPPFEQRGVKVGNDLPGDKHSNLTGDGTRSSASGQDSMAAKDIFDRNVREALERKYGKHGAAIRMQREKGGEMLSSNAPRRDVEEETFYSPRQAMGRESIISKKHLAPHSVEETPILSLMNNGQMPDVATIEEFQGGNERPPPRRRLSDYNAPIGAGHPLASVQEEPADLYNPNPQRALGNQDPSRRRTFQDTYDAENYTGNYSQRGSKVEESQSAYHAPKIEMPSESASNFNARDQRRVPEVEQSLNSQSMLMYTSDPTVLFGQSRHRTQMPSENENTSFHHRHQVL